MDIKKIDNYLLYIFILILPVFFYSQSLFSISFVILVLFVKAIKIVLTNKLTYFVGNFDLVVFLLAVCYLLSSIFISPNIYDSTLLPGTTTTIFVGAIIYFLINQLTQTEKQHFSYFLFGGTVIYTILVLLSITKVISWFAPAGGFLGSFLYIIPTLPVAVSIFVKQKSVITKILIVVASSIILFALTVSILMINKNKTSELMYPSFKESMNITKGALKENPVFGIGSGNYLYAFNKYRSIDFNKTDIWSMKFNQSTSFIITLLTEVGILGLVCVFALLVYIGMNWRSLGVNGIITFILLTVFIFTFPAFPITLLSLFVFLGLFSKNHKLDHQMPSKIVSAFVTLPLLILFSLVGYKASVISMAEYNYTLALKSLSENKAKDSYDSLKKAINDNNKVDRYHRTMSSINLAIANSISEESLGKSEEIPLFIQGAIDEAKAAVATNNKKSENWELLGRTYKLLIPFSDGADGFAIDAYKEAINLDPINPNLRIALGEVYMLKKDYKLAIENFNLAVLAKPDHPNAHFNLALAYKENGNLENARLELNETLSLLKAGSDDYKKAKLELDSLKK